MLASSLRILLSASLLLLNTVVVSLALFFSAAIAVAELAIPF